jgi:polyhydroxyalkanoate synthesis regulator phasin
MEDLFKKFVNAGVGYIAQGNKKIQSTIEALVKDSKITEQEGKKIVDELLKSGETKRAELEKQFQGLTERVKTTVGLGDKKKTSAKAASKPAAKTASSATSKQSSATAKAAGTVKKAADKVSTAAGTAQKSAAAKAGATTKPAAKPTAQKAAAPAAAKAEDNV